MTERKTEIFWKSGGFLRTYNLTVRDENRCDDEIDALKNELNDKTAICCELKNVLIFLGTKLR